MANNGVRDGGGSLAKGVNSVGKQGAGRTPRPTIAESPTAEDRRESECGSVVFGWHAKIGNSVDKQGAGNKDREQCLGTVSGNGERWLTDNYQN